MDIISSSSIIFLGCLIPGPITGLGALPIFVTKNVFQGPLNALLGPAVGAALVATCFPLIIPGIEYGGGNPQTVLIISLRLFLGAHLIDLVDRYVPHEHLIDKRVEGKNTDPLKQIWLFTIVTTIHNSLKDLATGVGSGTDSLKNGIIVALGIGLQNMPEGLVVALFLVRERHSTKKVSLITLLTGLIEPVGASLGVFLVQVSQSILPSILAPAGGAMFSAISDEIIPETHSSGYERQVAYGIIVGFTVMMTPGVTLG